MNLYDVLKKPKLTEKSGLLKEEFNQFVFEVDPKANKVQIKESVEKAFKVEVEKVRTMNVTGKKKRLGRHHGKKIQGPGAAAGCARYSSPSCILVWMLQYYL